MRGKLASIRRSLVDFRPGEWPIALLMFLYLFLVISTFAVVKPARSSLFLQQFGARGLPYAYLATALLAALVAFVHSRLLERYHIVTVQVLTHLFFISNVTFFWWAFRYDAPWLSAVFFLWVNIFTVTLNTLFWMFSNSYYNPREAKRLYGFINAGGTVGGIASGLAVSRWVERLGTENLLLVTAGVLGLCSALVIAVRSLGKERFLTAAVSEYVSEPSDPRQTKPESARAGLSILWESRYAKFIAMALGLSLVVSTLIDYQFNVIVEQAFPEKDQKTAFFSSFFAWVNALSFVLQFFLTALLLRRVGIGFTLLILPSTLLMGGLAMSVYPVLASAVFLKLSDGSLRYSIEQSTRDVLYLPIPNQVMNKLKALVDVFIQRLAKAVGSALILLLTVGIAFGFRVLSYVSLVLVVAWLTVALLLRKEYLEALKRFLRQENLTENPKFVRSLDRDSTSELVAALQSGDEQKALGALNLLESAPGRDLQPVLRSLLRHPSEALRARSLHLLAEGGDTAVVSEAEKLLREGSVALKEEAIHYLCATSSKSAMEKMQEFLGLPEERVQAAALACMANCGGQPGSMMAGQMLQRLIHDSGPGSDRSRIVAAGMLGHIRPPSALHGLLIPLLQDPSPGVARAALRSAESVLRRDMVPFVIERLGDPATADAASQALRAQGGKIRGTLRDYLNDEEVPTSIRARLPSVLASVNGRSVAEDLMSSLRQRESGVRYEIIKALNRIREREAELSLRREAVVDAILSEASEAYHLLGEVHRGTLEQLVEQPGDRAAPVERPTREYRWAIERIFRLVGLLYSPADIFNAYRSLQSPRPEVRASAVEFLDNLLPADVKKFVLTLVDDEVPLEEKLRLGELLRASMAGRHLLSTDRQKLAP